MMLKRSLLVCLLWGGIAACDNNVPSSPNYAELSGGSTSSTGGSAGSGGYNDSGGSGGNAGSGGSAVSAGGSVASGGRAGSSTGSGGTVTASGGVTGTGGTGSGGAVGHGGALGSGGAAASGGSSGASYSKDIAPMLKSNCTSCHAGAFAPSGVDLSTYAGAKANAGAANSAIQAGKMPPSGALSATNKQLFQSWVTEGAPNN